jgi:hypothetical protein
MVALSSGDHRRALSGRRDGQPMRGAPARLETAQPFAGNAQAIRNDAVPNQVPDHMREGITHPH